MRAGLGLSLVASLLALAGCADDPGEQPEPFFDLATVATWPEVRNCRFSIEHDGVQITVHTSPGAEAAYTAGTYPFAEGTVIVKPETDDPDCAVPIEFTAMRKLATGAAPADGDWEWQRVDADGTVLETGSLPRCVSCHRSCADRDYACTDP
jgi:hypothetical protein